MAKRNWVLILKYWGTQREVDSSFDEFTQEKKPTAESWKDKIDYGVGTGAGIHVEAFALRPAHCFDSEGRNALHPEYSGYDENETPDFGDRDKRTYLGSISNKEFRVAIDGRGDEDSWYESHSPEPLTAEEVSELFDSRYHDGDTEFEVQELWIDSSYNHNWETIATWKVCPACREAYEDGDDHAPLAHLEVIMLDGERKEFFDCPHDGDTSALMERGLHGWEYREACLTVGGEFEDLSPYADEDLHWTGERLIRREFTVEYLDPQHPEWGWEHSDSVTRPEDGDWKYLAEACAEGENGLPAKAEFRVVDQFDEVHGSWHWCDACQELHDGKHECPEEQGESDDE